MEHVGGNTSFASEYLRSLQAVSWLIECKEVNDAFVNKPIVFDEFDRAVNMIFRFWGKHNVRCTEAGQANPGSE